jgi:TetR/AcrR family transcriptional regulator
MGAAEPTTVPDTDIGGVPAMADRRLKPGPGRSAAEVTSHQRARIDQAMVEVVVERGFSGATVREIARVAGISTRAFYEHYSGKEECFLHVHRLLAQVLLRRVRTLADAGRGDDRLHAAVEAIIEEWERDWKVARFLLIGPYGAGPMALKQLRLVDRSLGARLSRCLSHTAEKNDGPLGLIADGIAAGLTATMRSTMLNEDGDPQRPDLRQGLSEWAVACSCSSSEIEVLKNAEACIEREDMPPRASSSDTEARASLLTGDSALLHSALGKLVASGDHDLLTPRRICTAAGVSRRSFDLHFSGIDDCLVAAAGLRVDLAVERARQVGDQETTPERRVFRSLVELCDQVACDPALASLCFGDRIGSGEWLVRRDRLLAGRIAGLCEPAGLTSHALEQLRTRASLGGVLGLFRKEVAAGRAACIHRKAPVLAYLMLVPLVGKSSAVKGICKSQR